ncbi:TPA: DUF551 domain-containing protein [Salmonella enterica subsp. diarizonae serovar 53:z10:z35]
MRLNPGDIIKSVHTDNAFVVEYVSTDGHCFILQPRGKENSRSYNMHDFNRSFVRVSESDTLQAGNSPVIPGGWISCSERMPEDEQEVIVHNKLGYRYVSYFDEHSGLFFDMRGGNQMNCIEHHLVTHWRPMPAPPQQ